MPEQPTPPRLTFEVASIRPSKPGGVGGFIKPLPGGIGYTSQNIPIKLIFSLMYRVPMRQISGGPEWLGSEPYDIEARADRPYAADDLREMFRNLLADRFNLKFHKDVREGNVYALSVDKAGLKMKRNDESGGLQHSDYFRRGRHDPGQARAAAVSLLVSGRKAATGRAPGDRRDWAAAGQFL